MATMSPSFFDRLIQTASLLLLVESTSAVVTNRTIDDENGDSVTGLRPIYAGEWNYGPTCTGCFVQPDESDLFDGTWHDVTASPTDPSPRNVTIQFNGTAVWVHCVVPNYVEYATTYVNISFELDGDLVGIYSHEPSDSIEYQYNVTVYGNTSLPNTEHTLVMTPQRKANASYMAFDWVEYSYDPDGLGAHSSSTTAASSTASTGTPTPSGSTTPVTTSSPSTHTTPVGAIAGGVIGGAAALAIGLLAFLYLLRRHRASADRIIMYRGEGRLDAIEEPIVKPEPYMDSPSTSQVALPSALHPQSAAEHGISEVSSSSLSAQMNSATGASSTALALTAASGSATATTRSGQGSGQGRSKAAMRREELARQMQDIEQHVADLQGRRSSVRQGSTPAESATEESNDMELRRQIESLQLEVERLRAEAEVAAAANDPPPAYEEAEEES